MKKNQAEADVSASVHQVAVDAVVGAAELRAVVPAAAVYCNSHLGVVLISRRRKPQSLIRTGGMTSYRNTT
jgi:hypothetical protein